MLRKFGVLALGVLLPCLANAAPVEVIYQPPGFPVGVNAGAPILDGWFSNIFEPTFQRNQILQIGGWGDQYRTYLQFDLKGLPVAPTIASLELYGIVRGSAPGLEGDHSTPVYYNLFSVEQPWSASITWSSQPGEFLQDPHGEYAPGPTPGIWSMDLTSHYIKWRNNTAPNNGLALMATEFNNNFDVWSSSRSPLISQRPAIRYTFNQPAGMGSFKSPLPAGASWIVLSGLGGYSCLGLPPDPGPENDYFTIVFSDTNKKEGGGSFAGNIPVLASAGGTVVQTGFSNALGYFVVLKHSGNVFTRYSGFSLPAARANNSSFSNGSVVAQGDQIGWIGNWGSTNKKLRMTFWYGSTNNASAELTYVVMDGKLLKGYQSECSVDGSGNPLSNIGYYGS